MYKAFTIIAAIAQLGERQTEDLKVPGSIPGRGIQSLASVSRSVRRNVQYQTFVKPKLQFKMYNNCFKNRIFELKMGFTHLARENLCVLVPESRDSSVGRASD